MKKIKSFAAMLLVALATMVSFTSCEDEMIAQDLEGTWKGNMNISSTWNGRTYNSTYTEIEFSMSPFRTTKGTGYWVDHYASDAPWEYVAYHFDWRVDDRRITIHYREDNKTVIIDNYRLTDNHFTGVIWDGDTRVDFSLVHSYSPNWDRYDYGWRNSYYSKKGDGIDLCSRSGESTDSIAVPYRFVRAK